MERGGRRMNRLDKVCYEWNCISDHIWRNIISMGTGDEAMADAYRMYMELPEAIRYQKNVKKEKKE